VCFLRVICVYFARKSAILHAFYARVSVAIPLASTVWGKQLSVRIFFVKPDGHCLTSCLFLLQVYESSTIVTVHRLLFVSTKSAKSLPFSNIINVHLKKIFMDVLNAFCTILVCS